MKIPVFLKLLLILIGLLLTVSMSQGQAATEAPGTFRNPLNPNNGADPWLTYYDGNYYLAATTWASQWIMRKSPTLAGLKTAEPVRIYTETDPTRCCDMWAPEFDLLDGPNGQRWYFYYTAGSAGNYGTQRSYVLESAGTDPMGPYTFKGKLYDPQNDYWSIDGTILRLNGKLYFVSSASINGLQSLVIAPMSNPWTLSGPHTLISKPTYDWEMQGGVVNEGPVELQHDGQTFIVYSASSCATPDYKLGMLTYTGGDPLSANSWVKHPDPVFQRSDANGVFGPGHNGFFKSPDGTEDWIVYHANSSTSAGCDGERSTRAQKFTWNADGTPNFGVPVATSESIAAPSGDNGVDPLPEFPPQVISRFKAMGFTNAYLRHTDFQLRVDFSPIPVADSEFVVEPGLADPTAVSLESVNFPGFFIRHHNNLIMLVANDGTEDYKGAATWWIRPGIADPSAISFEAYDQPGSYIGKRFGITALAPLASLTKTADREDATFTEEH